ncbi:MAG: Calx-beta domain-containing protein, partial [Nevskiales bacterium]
VNGDTTVEANESFFVNLSSPISGTITDNQGVGTIQNDDSAEPGSPAVSIADASVSEGAAGTTAMDFSVTLSSAPAQDVTVTYKTVDGTATSATGPGQDFTGVSNGSLVIPASQTGGTITININGDLFQENDENFSVEITGVSNSATLGDTVGIGSIVNDDEITLLMAGAAKVSVTPTDAQIAGQPEDYLGGKREQKFHLGGFGFGPFKFLPSYGGATPEIKLDQVSNPPARARCFSTEITPENITPENCEDNTWVRVLVLREPADGDRVAFVTLDAVGAGNLIQDAVKAKINKVSCDEGVCIKPENILFGQTHSHAGADLQGLWGGVPEDWIANTLY